LFLPKEIYYSPLHIQIDVTTYCNLQCKMCYAKKIILPQENNKHLTFEQFKHIIDTIKPLSVNMAANGEPFLNPQIFDMIKYANSKKIKTITSSNFILPKETIKKIIPAGLDILKISIDGHNEELYEKIRGKNFNLLIENIKFLQQLVSETKDNKPQLRFDFVIMKDNYHHIVDFIYFSEKFGVKYIYFHPIDIREYDEIKKKEIVEGVEMKELEQQILDGIKLAKKLKINTNLAAIKKHFEIMKHLYSGKDSKVKRKVCILPWMSVFINISGEVSPCCAIYPYKNISFGNIFDNDFNNVWNSEKAKLMRDEFKKLKNYDIYEACKYCLPMEVSTIINVSKTFPEYWRNILKLKK